MTTNGIHLNLPPGLSNQPGPPHPSGGPSPGSRRITLSVEWVAVLVTIVAVGVTTTAAVVTGFRRLNDPIDAGFAEATRERAEIRERLAHLEGTLDVPVSCER